jgi:hypothetical protein
MKRSVGANVNIAPALLETVKKVRLFIPDFDISPAFFNCFFKELP